MKLSAKYAAQATFAAFALAGSAGQPSHQQPHAQPIRHRDPAARALITAATQNQQDYINGCCRIRRRPRVWATRPAWTRAGSKLRGAEDGWTGCCDVVLCMATSRHQPRLSADHSER